MLTREVLRAIRQIVGAVDLAGMDIVEVVAAVRPCRDDGDGRQPRRARGDQRARRRAAGDGRTSRSAGVAAAASRPAGSAARCSTGPIRPRAAALARLYDLDLHDDPGDLDLYLALADRAGGPILELAAGTGRLAVPLAAAGHRVTAVDLDPAMLDRARQRRRRERGIADRPPRARRGRPASASRCPTPARTGSRSSPSTRSCCWPAAPSSGGAPRRSPTHLAPGRPRRRRRLAARCRGPRAASTVA